MPPVNRKNPVRAASSESEISLMEFMREYPDDQACLQSLWRNRYSPDGTNAHCPTCDTERVFARYESKQQRQAWNCTACGHYLYPTAGTIFHKSSTSLHLWFYAMYLMTSTRCGISAKQLERELGVTYKTAWRMAHLIRTYLMTQDETPLSGDVEMDEMYVGGRPRYAQGQRPRKPGRRPKAHPVQKTPVIGAVERRGRVYATVAERSIPNVNAVLSRVLPESTIFTDESRLYSRVPAKGYRHHRIRHRERVYVSGDIHTNTIEGFWSLTKNGLRGVYHAVSAKHLQGYLNEYAWRYNRRGQPKFRELLHRAASTPAG